jgi:hypothetical protein
MQIADLERAPPNDGYLGQEVGNFSEQVWGVSTSVVTSVRRWEFQGRSAPSASQARHLPRPKSRGREGRKEGSLFSLGRSPGEMSRNETEGALNTVIGGRLTALSVNPQRPMVPPVRHQSGSRLMVCLVSSAPLLTASTMSS